MEAKLVLPPPKPGTNSAPVVRPRSPVSGSGIPGRAGQIVAANELAWLRWRTAAAGSPALDRWLVARGLDPTAVRAAGWALGWAAPGWTDVADLLERHRIPLQVGLESGLVRRAESGRLYDGFRARIVVPVRGLLDGRIYGFTARRIDDGEVRATKYVNSPTNSAYRKSQLLLGSWEARQLLRTSREQVEALVVCEGPFDVIRIACTGSWAAVAPCGTAMTRPQAEWIVALARAHELPVLLAYDGDAAGEAAAWKAWDLLIDLKAPGLRLADVPEGRDPGELSSDEISAALSQPPRGSVHRHGKLSGSDPVDQLRQPS